MKLHVNRFDFTGDLATDLQNGLITAFDDADNLMSVDDAINKLTDGAKVAGVSAPNDQSAKRVYDGVRRMRSFSAKVNDATPEPMSQLSSYEKHKRTMADAWKGEPPKQSNDSQPAKLHAYDSFKQRLADGWKLFTDDKGGE
ncbi:hypothetical protein [Vibrio algivorus]|uniref:Uncharacterized protein n=1 Tax=Vibrio algivorus TaxID=1667024 RepID=A0ABQ6EPE4_9VIBR|nr:hypothetical protein [Vibrio algivorus]GLT15003.1 hypothetical protein GCM10007931_19780 [Vibrio algivorus]